MQKKTLDGNLKDSRGRFEDFEKKKTPLNLYGKQLMTSCVNG
jgi:hypothetical protein